jgi:hypothetical protein
MPMQIKAFTDIMTVMVIAVDIQLRLNGFLLTASYELA